MKQIVVRTDKFYCLEDLSYEERGKIFTALLLLGADDASHQDELASVLSDISADRFLSKSFAPLSNDFAEDKAKYDKIVSRNRANGCKGGRPRKNPGGSVKTQYAIEKPTETQKTSIYGYSTNNLNNNICLEKEKERDLPSLDDVLSVARQCCITDDIATRFYNHYNDENWMIRQYDSKGNIITARPIANWRAKLMEWKNNPLNNRSNANTNTNHDEFVARRNESIKQATIAAIESSQRGITREVDLSIL